MAAASRSSAAVVSPHMPVSTRWISAWKAAIVSAGVNVQCPARTHIALAEILGIARVLRDGAVGLLRLVDDEAVTGRVEREHRTIEVAVVDDVLGQVLDGLGCSR